MSKLIVLYSLFLSIQVFGYSQKQIALSDYEFRRYVRPQLRSISNDFQTLLFALNPELKEFKSSYNDIRSMYSQIKEIEESCSENFINDDCFKLIKKVNSITKGLLKSNYLITDVKVNDVDEKNIHYHIFEDYQNQVLSLWTYTDSLLFQKQYLDFFIFDHAKLMNEVREIYSFYNLFLLKSSFKPTRQEFTSYWIGFIKPIYDRVLIYNKIDYFKHNITEFNMTWNILNVKLTKRNIPISKQVSTILNIMHNRWNNILKVSLKPN